MLYFLLNRVPLEEPLGALLRRARIKNFFIKGPGTEIKFKGIYAKFF
jgi:hypothetical protein